MFATAMASTATTTATYRRDMPVKISRGASAGDSSDDDLPAPMKFSALTKALLDEEPSVVDEESITSPAAVPASYRYSAQTPSRLQDRHRRSPVQSRANSPVPFRVVRLSGGSGSKGSHTARHPLSAFNVDGLMSRESSLRESSRSNTGSGSPMPPLRVVRLGGNSRRSPTPPSTQPQSVLRSRSPSPEIGSGPEDYDVYQKQLPAHELITPAPRPRSVRLKDVILPTTTSSAGSYGNPGSSDSKRRPDSEDVHAPPVTVTRNRGFSGHDSAHRYGSSTIGRSRQTEETAMQGSQRMKRVGKVSGMFLSGPARRGRRRQSEEDQSPDQDDLVPSQNSVPDTDKNQDHGAFHIYQEAEEVGTSYGSPPAPASRARERDDRPAAAPHNGESKSILKSAHEVMGSSYRPEENVGIENENPKPVPISQPDIKGAYRIPMKSAITPGALKKSPERRPLAALSQNTPLRQAPPPPPKMSVLETATATAGAAATSQSKQRRNHVKINGKVFTRLDCIGRGGSSRVYKVMAGNFKIFALKKVSLEDVDELTVRGYKGEIELLQKLADGDRVVRLFDYEVNDEKQTLSMLMEIGESDLDRILKVRANADNPRLDLSFTRYYWKEMLECVDAVHAAEIVHSDLKPANFLMVQGRLKLIDFGIANAIQDDTVNVHREQQVGTPNYMSPEAIVDFNAVQGRPASEGRLMKIGKPSDVWSLGCILYKMVYGDPPFAKLTNPIQRIMAIPNPNHQIDFPERGVGGVTVPQALIRTLRGCLERDPSKRPSIDELLHHTNPFLYPEFAARDDGATVEVSQELLGRILQNVVTHCKNAGIPSDAELSTWPANFFTRIRRAKAEQGVS